MAVVITHLAKDNAKARYRARRAAKREQAAEDMRLARKVATAASGCSLNVARATSAPSLRDKHEIEQTPALKRKLHSVRSGATHIVNAKQKMRGKCITLI